MKYCTQCGLHMIESFKSCPRCQTDTHVVVVKNYGDATPKTTEVIPMNECQPNEARLKQLKTWRTEHRKSVALLEPALNILIATRNQNLFYIPGLQDAIESLDKCLKREADRLKDVEEEYDKLFEKMREQRKEEMK